MTDVEDMTLMDKVAAIKASVGPLDLADSLDLDVVDGKIHSPYNQADDTPSCHLYEDHFYDYSTGNGGDVIDLYMLLAKCSWGSAVNRLLKGAMAMDADVGRIQRPTVVEADLTDQWRQLREDYHSYATFWVGQLKPLTAEFLWDMHLNNQLIAGEDTMWIPHWHNGKVTGIKIRQRDGRKSAVPGSQFGRGLYFADRWPDNRVAVIAEGESDCWAMAQALDSTVNVYALPGGAGLWRDQWLQELQQYGKVYTCFDNDQAGQKATEKVRRAVGWGRWQELKVPQLYNDAREALAAGWVPKLK